MKKLLNIILVFLSFFIVTSCIAQAEEQTTLAKDDYFLAISFADKDTDRRRFKFNESVTQLDVEALYKELEQVGGINQVFLYKDGIAITRQAGTPWADLEKKVMRILKDQYKVTGYVLFDGNKLTEEQIARFLTGL